VSAFDALRIGALARALDLSPRQLLVAAMQPGNASAADSTNEAERLRQAIAQVRAAPRATEAAAALLLTPIASFARDDIDRALAGLWSAVASADD
jgi:hypothetical protein